jgi:hypothetical protein
MFSEGADTEASAGVVTPCGGFSMLVPYIDYTI